MKSTILIGYMCVGKTTVGRALAKRTGRMFYDLDWYIEERYHQRVSEIFANGGEERFRDLERRMLHEVAEFEDVVVACGGGTPCFFDNAEYMNSVGNTFYLSATPDVILSHLNMSRGKRPLLEGKTGEELRLYVEQQLAERIPYYEKARHTISISTLDDFSKIDRIAELIQSLESEPLSP